MLKRKRSGNEPLEERLDRYKTDLFRALKKVKGFERQRLSRRVHDKDLTADKKQKYELEIAVLKSLDLHQTAFHYLYTSLLKIKAIATHPDLPEVVRKEIPKPELEEAEREALHHVTSCLFNRLEVRQVMDKVVAEVCGVLGVPAPEKKKGKKKGKDIEEEATAPEKSGKKTEAKEDRVKKPKEEESRPTKEKRKHKKEEEEQEEGSSDEDLEMEDGMGDMDTDEEEAALAKFDRLLAASSDEDESDAGADWESESDTGATAQKGRRSIRVRDMSISLSPEPHSGSEGPSDVDISEPDWESEDELEPESKSESESESESEDERPAKQAKFSASSKPSKQTPKRKPIEIKASTFVTSLRDAASPVSYSSDSDSDSDAAPRPPKAKKVKTTAGRGALPSLMGGYMEGSESASDVDVAPRKKRLGQKQRQAIWEKKFGAKARHIEKQQQQEQQRPGRKGGGGGRDDGWDMKRGAVGEEDQRGRGKPWKKGISGPLSAMRGGGARGGRPGQGQQQQEEERRPRPSTKRDDEGPLHPSWAARKKAKEQAPRIMVQPSAANKIVFDD